MTKSEILKLFKKKQAQGKPLIINGREITQSFFDNLVKPKKSKVQKDIDKAKKERTDLTFQLLCEKNGLPKPIPEYKFHATRKWRCDYYFERDGLKVALEVEGAIYKKTEVNGKVYVGGRHNIGKGYENDLQKYNAMTLQGIYLLRVQPKEISSLAIELLKTFFNCW